MPARAPGPLALGLLAASPRSARDAPRRRRSTGARAAYQRRAGSVRPRTIREKLLGAYPKMEPHARLWFMNLPNNIGFLAGDGPAVRVCTGIPRSGRTTSRPTGARWTIRGPTTASASTRPASSWSSCAARAPTPSWRRNDAQPSLAMDGVVAGERAADGKGLARAALEFRRLAIAYPESSGFARRRHVFLQAGGLGPCVRAGSRAARRPGATPESVRAVSDILPRSPGSGRPGPAHVHRRGAGAGMNPPAAPADNSSTPRDSRAAGRATIERGNRSQPEGSPDGQARRFDEDARQALWRGIDQLASAVRITPGARPELGAGPRPRP